MGQQDVRAQIVRGPLANASIQYRNGLFVGDQVFPIVNIDSPKTKIWTYDKGSMFRNEAGYRAPGAEARRSGMTGSWTNITSREYALASEVTDEDRRFAKLQLSPPTQPDQEAIEFCANAVDLKKEINIASAVLTSTWADGVGSGGEDAEGLWAATDSTNTMLADVQKAFRAIYGKIGMQPGMRSCMLVDQLGFDEIVKAFAAQAAFVYTAGGRPTPEWIKNFLKLDELLIAASYYDSGNEKKAGGQNTITQIWQVTSTKGCAFCYVRPQSIGLKTVTPGIQARLAYGQEEGGGYRRTTVWREENKHQDVYEVAEETAVVQVCADAGYGFKDIILT